MEDGKEEGLCSICREYLKEAVSIDCGHLFCRGCLAHHLKSSTTSETVSSSCPICRAPCSEKVLGEGYVCQSHQKRVSFFCEESSLLLCVKCRESTEHQAHRELTIEDAISHYKERLGRRIRKLKKDLGEHMQLKAQEEEKLQTLQGGCGNHRLEAELKSQHQDKWQLNAFPQQQLDQLEDVPARVLDISNKIQQLTELERAAKQVDANNLKEIKDLLNRSAPQK